MVSKGVSVIVCCYNSSAKLPDTLKHLAAQKVNVSWEVIVVNNNSSDNTADVALQKWSENQSSIPFSILEQPVPGLSPARRKGIANAQFEYLIFCDDDNWLDVNYVQTAYYLLEQNSSFAMFGGLNEPVFEVEPPSWINQYIGGYACGVSGNKTGEVNGVFGAGMALRKKLLDQLHVSGFESILSGRLGSTMTSGEDSELCKVFTLLGYKIGYDEQLKLKHFISKERLNWQYCKKLFASFGQSSVLLDLYDRALITPYSKDRLPLFYWLRNYLYFLLIQIKYHNKYKNELNIEGSGHSIIYLSWNLKMKEYWRLKWTLNGYYKDIMNLKRILKLQPIQE